MKKTLVVPVLLCCCVLSGCRDDGTPVDPPVSPPLLQQLTPQEEQVVANCYTVQEAAEAFAAENNGGYPQDTWVHVTPLGNNLVSFLPGGVRLENPFTQIRTEPMDGLATLSGYTGYVAIWDSMIVGYTISGFGVDSLVIILSKYP